MKISKELENRSAIDGGCHCFDAKKTRRDFLSRASCLAVAVLVYEGIRAKDAEAFSLSFVSANPEGAECSFDVPSSDGASVELENQVILVRTANRIYAFALACPHENTALRWRAKDGYFQCPAPGEISDGRRLHLRPENAEYGSVFHPIGRRQNYRGFE